MKRPPTAHLRRPNSVCRRPPRTRTEAAVELVKVEFQRDRLRRGLMELKRRGQLAAEELRTNTRRADQLLSRLAEPEGEPWP
jgi:hypothetical protein